VHDVACLAGWRSVDFVHVVVGEWNAELVRCGCFIECDRLMTYSATDVRVERRRDADQLHRGQAAASSGKLASPCGPSSRVQRGPGPPLLPGKVRSSGSDR